MTGESDTDTVLRGASTEAGYRFRTEPDENVSTAVVEAVAAVTDTSPMELEPLAESIDPDALDRLFGDSGRRLTVEFAYAGCAIVATGSTLQIRETEAR